MRHLWGWCLVGCQVWGFLILEYAVSAYRVLATPHSVPTGVKCRDNWYTHFPDET